VSLLTAEGVRECRVGGGHMIEQLTDLPAGAGHKRSVSMFGWMTMPGELKRFRVADQADAIAWAAA
jgi:hypothetical protein